MVETVPVLYRDESARATTSNVVQPLPKPFEFRATIERKPGIILGFELDLLDGVRAQVCTIRPGVVEDYNKAGAGEEAIKTTDYIVEVNGAKGKAQDLYRKLKKGEGAIDLLLRRCPTYIVRVQQKVKDGSLIDTLKRAREGVSLLLLEVHDVFKDWNAANPLRNVRKHDRILEVNGVSMNTTKMLEELQDAIHLVLVMQSPCE